MTDDNARGAILPAEQGSRVNASIDHIQTSTSHGPDFCKGCSDAAQEWVTWPCPAARADAAERARDAALAEVTGLRDRLGRVEALCLCKADGCPCGGDRVVVPTRDLRAALVAVPVTGDTVDASPAAEDTTPDHERGLYGKYRVERISDPTGKHADCRCFVLDPQHDRHAHAALAFYAAEVESEYPQLADDIDVWLMGAASPTEQATEGGA